MESYIVLKEFCALHSKDINGVASAKVFFDEARHETVVVTDDGHIWALPYASATQSVICESIVEAWGITLAKFSPDQSSLAVRVEDQLLRIKARMSNLYMTHMLNDSRNSCNTLLGFEWIDNEHLLLVTSSGMEIFKLFPTKKTLKCIKTFQTPVSWYHFDHKDRLLLLRGVDHSPEISVLEILDAKKTIGRNYRFSVVTDSSLPVDTHSPQVCDLHVFRMYGKLFVSCFLAHRQEVWLSFISADRLERQLSVSTRSSGRVRPFVIDNILVLCNLDTSLCLLFDARHGIETPFVPPFPPLIQNQDGSFRHIDSLFTIFQGSPVFFEDCFLFDSVSKVVFRFSVDLKLLINNVPSILAASTFLMRRENAKKVLLELVHDSILRSENLVSIGSVFDVVNQAYISHIVKKTADDGSGSGQGFGGGQHNGSTIRSSDSVRSRTFGGADERRMSVASSVSLFSRSNSNNEEDVALLHELPIIGTGSSAFCIVDQHDMYSRVFFPLEEQHSDHTGFILSSLLEYIRSLHASCIPVQHFIFEFLIRCLVKLGKFADLHILIQYNVISASVPVAMALFSLRDVYYPAGQLGLDMFQRLRDPLHIFELLLASQNVGEAMEFMLTIRGLPKSLDALLEAAASKGDRYLALVVRLFLRDFPDVVAPYLNLDHVWSERIRRVLPDVVVSSP
eukprot:ANDGO_04846.mRNA.1 Mic1 domain-containing protein DDB_G0286707